MKIEKNNMIPKLPYNVFKSQKNIVTTEHYILTTKNNIYLNKIDLNTLNSKRFI